MNWGGWVLGVAVLVIRAPLLFGVYTEASDLLENPTCTATQTKLATLPPRLNRLATLRNLSREKQPRGCKYPVFEASVSKTHAFSSLWSCKPLIVRWQVLAGMGPKNHINIRISLFCSKAQYQGDSRNHIS